jgi:hypothetical protein
MIITRIIGGLGNQMFQYAAGLALAKAKQTELKVDISGFETGGAHMVTPRNYGLDQFDMPVVAADTNELTRFRNKSKTKVLRTIQRFFPFLFKTVYFSESGTDFHPAFFQCPDQTYLEGYWQSEKYFKGIETSIREAFVFKKDISDSVSHLSANMKSVNSVSIHVRRGDYLKLQHVYEVCSADYYLKAVQVLSEKVSGSPVLFVFSDDIDWCKENLNFQADLHVVQTGDPYKDLFLMTQCRHHIIANSSYSWWGAWLNAHPDKIVIAPKKWYHHKQSPDIYPQNWITI